MATLTRTPIENRPGWFEQYLPAPEACKRIKALARNRQTKKARTVFLHVEQHGRTDDEHYFPISGNVKIGRAGAIEYVEEAYKSFTERGALVHLSWCDTCLFVG